MNARFARRALFVAMGILLLLIVVVDFLDTPAHAEKNIMVNVLFVIGGISIIFFNTRK